MIDQVTPLTCLGKLETVIYIFQIVLLISTTFLGSMVGFSLVQGDPLENLISPAGCHFFWLTIVITSMTLVSGGLTMALLRLIVIKLEITGAEARKVMWRLIAFQSIVELGFITGVGYGNYYSNTGLAYTFCRGHSAEMSKIMAKHQGSSSEDIAFGIKFVTTSVVATQLMILVELLSYCCLHDF